MKKVVHTPLMNKFDVHICTSTTHTPCKNKNFISAPLMRKNVLEIPISQHNTLVSGKSLNRSIYYYRQCNPLSRVRRR